jgi:hypothetical protein
MRASVLLISLLMILAEVPALAQGDVLTYQMPPQVLADIIDAPPTPGVYLSPDNEWLLSLERPGLVVTHGLFDPGLRRVRRSCWCMVRPTTTPAPTPCRASACTAL